MTSRPSIHTSRESLLPSRTHNGKLVKRNPGQVHFAPPTTERPGSHSSTSLSHYQLQRHSRPRSREHSRSRSPPKRSRLHELVIESDSDEDDQIVFTPYAPRRPRTPDSPHAPRTPASAAFSASTPALVQQTPAKSSDLPFPTRSAATMPTPIAQMRLACVTSTDILNVLNMHDTIGREQEPIVPFPYTVHWPELPASPPLSPPLTPPSAEKAIEDEPPKQQVETVKAASPERPAAKRKAWSQAPLPKRSSSQPGSGRKNSFLNWVHPHPPVTFPPSVETPLVIPISPLPMSPIEVDIPADKLTSAIGPVTSVSARAKDNGSAPLADPAAGAPLAESEPCVDVAGEEPVSSASSLTLLAPPRPTHARSRSEPIADIPAIEPSSTGSTGLAVAVETPPTAPISTGVAGSAKPVTAPPPPAHRKLQKKKRASAPPGTLTSTAAPRPGAASPLSVISNAPTTKSTFSFGSGTASSKTVVASSPEPVSSVTIGPVPPRKKRISTLALFSSSASKSEQPKVKDEPATLAETLGRKRNMSTPMLSTPMLTPPTTPRDSLGQAQPNIVVTPPTAPTSAVEGRKTEAFAHRKSLDGAMAALGKKNENTASTQGKTKPKHRRLASLFGGSSASNPTTVTASASAPTLIRLDSPPPARPVRTTVRTAERDNVKLWPVPGSSAPVTDARPVSETSSAPTTPLEGGLQPSSDVAAWGRASTLSLTMTLLMGSGSAARTTRRLRKADGVVREPKPEQEEVPETDKLPAEPELHRWRARSVSTPSLLLAPTPSVPTPELGALLRAFEDDGNESDSDDSEFGGDDHSLAPRAGARVSFADNASTMTRRDAILSVVHELRRQRLDGNGLPSSSVSTHSSVNSSMLLYRPLRARRSSFGAASSLRLQL